MKILNADDIFKTQDIKVEAVVVPEWGGRLYVRLFSAKTREEFDALITGDGDTVDTRNIRARVVALTACDEKGNALFTADQAEQLGEKSNPAIDRVYDAAAKLNKLRKQDRDGEKKESANPPSGDSVTA